MKNTGGYTPTYRYKDGILWIRTRIGEFVDSRNINPQMSYTVDNQLMIHKSGAQYREEIEEVCVRVRPLITKNLTYCRDECLHTEPVAPPSTGGWYARLFHGVLPAVFITQEVEFQDIQWLTIIDESTGEIFESHPILMYEGYALPPQPVRTPEFEYSDNIPSRDDIIRPLLNKATPEIQSLYKLIGDATIPHLRFGGFEPKESVRETLEQIVPQRWSQNVREEIMAFLSYVMSDPVFLDSSVDPVSFSLRYQETPHLRNLILFHQIRLLRGEEDYSEYLPLMWLYELQDSLKDSTESIDGSGIAAFIYSEIVRDALYYDKHVQDYIIKMKQAKSVPAGLPVNKDDASKSRQARLQRLMYVVGGLYVLGRVDYQRVGLRSMIYIGKGYRWPHQHLEYALTLEDTRNHSRPTMIHSISVPPEVEEILLEKRVDILPVSWYVQRTNPRHFSTQDADWRFNYGQLLASLDPQYEKRSFERGYGLRKQIQCYNELNQVDIRVMDLISSYLDLSDLEFPSFVKSRGFESVEQIITSIEKLAKNDVLSLIYDLIPGRVRTLAIIARGNERSIISLFRALLQKTPRCTCYSLDSGKQYLAFVRCSRYMGEVFRELLPSWAEENGVKLTCSFCSTTGNYRSNLFQRLRKENETWDSDITGLLVQITK